MSRIKFPLNVLKPVQAHLKDKQNKLKKRKMALEQEDPFNDVDRVNDNAAVDTDAAEGTGHARVIALKLEVDKTLIRIKKALTKIRLGRYGLCENCKNLIDTDRLAIDPTATHCINCANGNKK